jgi:hypothetical protein
MSARRQPSTQGNGRKPVEYDLHGAVGVRLVDPRPGDARAVDRQLGPLRATLDREPDILIRFVDDLRLASPLHYLGLDEAGFTADAFLVLHSKHHAKARVMIPFQHIGGRCEIVCESGLPAVPLLIPILNLTALARGLAPLHASAFVHRGAGVLVTGWSKGGKTEALLAFMSRGAEYLGDEWIYVGTDSGRMCGIPQPIRLWNWHLDQFPQYRQRIGRGHRARLGAIEAGLTIGRRMLGTGAPASAPLRAIQRVHSLVKRQAHVDVAPERLFGPCGRLEAPIDRVFFLGSRAEPGVVVEPIEMAELVRRMVSSVRFELQTFLSYYLMFQFAFPGARNLSIEAAEQNLHAALQRGLEGKAAHAVYHPYPMSIAALFDAMNPLLSGTDTSSSGRSVPASTPHHFALPAAKPEIRCESSI